MDCSGQPTADVNIGARMATGLVLTSNGLATVAVKNRRQFLIQFDRSGSVIHEKVLDCFGAGSLLAMSGNPAIRPLSAPTAGLSSTSRTVDFIAEPVGFGLERQISLPERGTGAS
jgi:hypothetical protein